MLLARLDQHVGMELEVCLLAFSSAHLMLVICNECVYRLRKLGLKVNFESSANSTLKTRKEPHTGTGYCVDREVKSVNFYKVLGLNSFLS